MNCPMCRTPNMSEREGVHVYDANGVKAVLQNATIRTCDNCDERTVGIRRLAQLNAKIAESIALKEGRLSAPEIRFLRTHIGWSGADLARHFRVSPATVSRWENGKQAMGSQVELLLRLVAYQCEPVQQYISKPFPLDDLAVLGAGEDSLEPMAFSLSPSNAWNYELAS